MIGIFDSGLGGLTVLRAILSRLPSADVIYFGDTGNAPYGPKSRKEISWRTVEGIRFLKSRGASNVVVACNSASASITLSLFDAFQLAPNQLIEMVGPTTSFFRGSKSRIAVCATQATIQSGLYQNAFRMIGIDIVGLAIPNLAAAIESGESETHRASLIQNALDPIKEALDVLILGCTHYPIALQTFIHAVPRNVIIFDPAEAVANRVERQFFPRESGDGLLTFVISKESAQFRLLAKQLFPSQNFEVEVVE
jgi:glutamate racemase